MVTACLVRGQMVASDGSLLSGGVVRFTPPAVVKGEDTVTILPSVVETTTDAEARFTISLVPDTYSVVYLDDKGRTLQPSFQAVVPPLPAIELEAIRVGAGPMAVVLSGGDADDVPEIVLTGGSA